MNRQEHENPKLPTNIETTPSEGRNIELFLKTIEVTTQKNKKRIS